VAGLSDQEIEVIAQRIVASLTGRPAGDEAKAAVRAPAAPAGVSAGDLGVFDSLNEAVRAAGLAFRQFNEMGLTKRDAIIESIRKVMRENRDSLARQAH